MTRETGMFGEQGQPTLAVVDNVDPDNMFQVLALMAPESDLQGVVVTGRAAAASREAALHDISHEESEFRTILNAVRMRNFMDIARPGHDIPVFAGTPAPETLVPHSKHVDELVFGDLLPGQEEQIRRASLSVVPGLRELGLAGNIITARKYLRSEVGEFSIVVGGPMTDVDRLLDDEAIQEKTIDIHAQFGAFGFGEQKLMEFGDRPRGLRQFNVACDVPAADNVLTNFPGDIHMYPTDVTRVNAISFRDGQDLADFLPDNAGTRQIADIYDIAFREMIQPRGPEEKIFIHDVAPALGSLALPTHRRTGDSVELVRGPYTERPARITSVLDGEIKVVFIDDPTEIPATHRRYIADSVDPEKYMQAVYDLTK